MLHLGLWCLVWDELLWDASSTKLKIAIKELASILAAAIIWVHKWKGSVITAHCDNKAVMCILASRYSRDDYPMHMLRILFFVGAHFQFELSSTHIPGISNTSADCLSRNQLGQFHISDVTSNPFEDPVATV